MNSYALVLLIQCGFCIATVEGERETSGTGHGPNTTMEHRKRKRRRCVFNIYVHNCIFNSIRTT